MNNIEDKNKFLKIIYDNENIIHKICHVYGNTKEDRNDLYQEIILQLWKSYLSFESKSSFSTWMYRVALNTAISQIKRTYKTRKICIDKTSRYEISEQFEKKEELRSLYIAIGRLSKIEKAIVLLWLEDKTYEEISDITGLTLKNVSVKLVRIKNKLSRIIKSMEGGNG